MLHPDLQLPFLIIALFLFAGAVILDILISREEYELFVRTSLGCLPIVAFAVYPFVT